MAADPSNLAWLAGALDLVLTRPSEASFARQLQGSDGLRRTCSCRAACHGGEDGRHSRESVMPRGSSPKRERQYEHIKESYEDRGVGEDEAEERAARTVNKQRREHGEAKSR